MNSEKWNSVLIEWVNCLKLGKNIQNVNELRNGEFFANLQKVINKSRKIPTDALTFIFDVFGKHYPNFSIENKSQIHLNDLPENDLKAITSLLMHYTCIYDRRDVLTSPLCHSLSQSTQIIIRNFLQKIIKDVTNETINEIVKSCIDDASDHLTNQWLSVEPSSPRNSPLQELLKTPVSKFGRIQQKDRIITALKSELELERYEKADLQEELKQQIEKNKKIDKQLVQKSAEITRLRNEVLALENRTPPYYQDIDSREQQRLLRVEIENLEQYVHQLETEQEELRKDKDAAKEQLRKFEAQSTIWEEKFFETERNFESLTEYSKQQAEELKNLRSHCSELTALLDEYRTKPTNDSSYENLGSINGSRELGDNNSYEDLAGSVIEVQLRDAHKQNEELKTQIGQLEELASNLRGQLESVTAELKKTRDECRSLQNSNDESKAKVAAVESQFRMSQNQLSETSEALKLATIQSRELKDQLDKVEALSHKYEKELRVVVDENWKIKELLVESEESLKKLNAETSKQLELLQSSNEKMLLKVESLESEKIQLKNDMESTERQLQELKNIKTAIEHQLYDSQAFSEKIKIELRQALAENERITNELKENKSSLAKLEGDNEILLKNLRQSDEKCDKLGEEKEKFAIQNEINQKQLSELSNDLELKKKSIEEMANSQKITEQKLREVEAFSDKLKTELEELHLEKRTLTKLLEENEQISKKMGSENEILISKLHELGQKIDILDGENRELSTRNDKLQTELTDTGNKLRVSEDKCEELKNTQEQLQLQFHETRQFLEKIQMELEDAQLEKEKITDKLNENERFAVMLKEENQILTIKLRDSNEKCDDLKQKNQELLSQISKLQEQLSETINTLEMSKRQSEELQSVNEALGKRLQDKETKLKELEKLRCDNDTLAKKLSENMEILSELKTDKENLLSNLQQCEDKCQKLADKNDELNNHNETLQKQMSDILNEWEMSKAESNKLIENMQDNFKQQLLEVEEHSTKLATELKDTHVKNQNINEELIKVKNNSERLQNDKNALIAKLQHFEMKMKEFFEKSEILQKQLSIATNNLELERKQSKESRDALDDLRKQLEEAETFSEKLRSELKDVHLENETLKVHLDENQQNFAKLASGNDVVLSKLQQSDEKQKELDERNVELLKQNESLLKQLTEMQNNLKSSEKQTEELKKIQSNLEKKLCEMEKVSEQVKIELNEALNENQKINDRLDESQKYALELANDKETLVSKLRESLEKYEKSEQKNEELLTHIRFIQKELSEEIDNLELSNKQTEELKTQLIEATACSENLKTELKVSRLECQKIKEKLDETEEILRNSESNNDLLQKQLAEVLKTLEESNLCQRRLNETNEVVSSELNAAEGNLLELKDKFGKLDEKYDKLLKENQQLLAETETLQKHLAEATEKSEFYKSRVTDLEKTAASLKTLENDKKNLKEQLEKSEKRCEDLLCKNEIYQKQFSDLSEELNEVQNALEKELNETSAVSKKLRTELCKVQCENYKISEELEESRRNCTKLENENEEIRKQSFELINTLDVVKKHSKESEQIQKQLILENQDLMKRVEDAELQKEKIKSLEEELKQVSEEKLAFENKIEFESTVAMITQEKMKTLEETVQDYEITISGLKSVIDNHLESLHSLQDDRSLLLNEVETLQNELSEVGNKEKEGLSLMVKLLKDNNIECVEESKIVDVNSFLFNHLEKVLITAKQEHQHRLELEKEIEILKMKNGAAAKLNSSLKEMIVQLQTLVMDSDEIVSIDGLKTSFDKIQERIYEALQVKKKLESDTFDLINQLETIKNEKEQISQAKIELESNNRLLQNILKEERDKVKSLTEQKTALMKEIEIINAKNKPMKLEKENVLGEYTRSNVGRSREEELKKENMMLKRKVVLTENAKNNLEKVLKELRKKNEALNEDVHYKKLLQEYVEVKEEHERVLKEKDEKYQNLLREFEQYKSANQTAEDHKKLCQDLQNIREAYGNVMSVNSKLEMEIVTLRKLIEERNTELSGFAHVKEAYEKLLEENSKLMSDIDTAKYKRIRDKEEFVRLLKKERENTQTRETKKIQDIKTEYEGKLERMKEKMVQLYKEEMNKREQAVLEGHGENLTKTVANLKSELFEAHQRIHLLEMEKEILKTNKNLENERITASRDSILPTQTISTITTTITSRDVDTRKAATLPRPSFMEEVTVSRRTSIGPVTNIIQGQNLQMEDEEDLFNDKYLTDLKEGRCAIPAGRESTTTRFSELAWRNSLVPPHLKSSYPAETQFVSPTRFKDEDIKSGQIEFEDSLCKLLPGEKPRKKDFGTTSYKRPGPPTPSKNGGRLSLQGNEVHPLREHCEAKTPKKSTPSRIRALFTGRISNTTKEGSESHNTTPSANKSKRLNIFRKPR